MRRLWLTLMLLGMTAVGAKAADNAGGTLIWHVDETLVYTSDIDNYCGMSSIDCGFSFECPPNNASDCLQSIQDATPSGTRGVAETEVMYVFAAFPEGSCPRLAGLTFGLDYDDSNIFWMAYGACGNFELSEGSWPAPFSGTAITWSGAQQSNLVEAYWFAGYAYYNADTVTLIEHPSQGGNFANDAVPAELDPVEGFSIAGLAGATGTNFLPVGGGDPEGACCFVDGSCQVLTAEDCSGAEGSYQGDDSSCDPNPCPQPEGACCFDDGSCVVQTEAKCDAGSGVYQGDFTSCDPNPCPQPEGACCLEDGTCQVAEQELCKVELLGTYQGDGTGCDPNPCEQPMGACCFDDGSCQMLTEADCAGAGGDFQGTDVTCDPNPCEQPTGACCLVDGSCQVADQDLCEIELNGEYQGDGTGCDPNPCEQPMGACCFEDGSCQMLTEADCADAGGDFQGTDVTCDPNPCEQPLGACCFEDGSCQVLTEADCADAGGDYFGNGSSCDPNPCDQPTGACCFEDGSCEIRTEADCGDAGGDYQGDGTSCDPNPCDQPMGACCYEDGSCQMLTMDDCGIAGGDYQGDGTTCDPNPCDQPMGACCYEDGSCQMLTMDDCGIAGGDYQGDGTTCDPNPCDQPMGACCFPTPTGGGGGVACMVTTADECESLNGDYQGDGTTCDPDPCVAEPGVLEIVSDPSGTHFEASGPDGDFDGTTPYMAEVTPGEYTITWIRPGYGGCTEDVMVMSGETTLAECDLTPYFVDILGQAEATPNPMRVDLSNGAPAQTVNVTVSGFRGTTAQNIDLGWIFLGGVHVDEAGARAISGADGGTVEFQLSTETIKEAMGVMPANAPQKTVVLDLWTRRDNGRWIKSELRFLVVLNSTAAALRLDGSFEATVRPNPARESLWIEWNSPVATETELVVYDASGRVLRQLVSGAVGAGFNQAQWDGRDAAGQAMPSGVYYYRLQIKETGQTLSDKIYLVR